MKMYRTKLLGLIGLIFSIQSHSQIKIPVTNNELRTNLQKIITDFPSHFTSLRGDTIIENPQTIEFCLATRLQIRQRKLDYAIQVFKTDLQLAGLAAEY